MMWFTTVRSAGGGGGGGGGELLFDPADESPVKPLHPVNTRTNARAVKFRGILISAFDESGCSRVVLGTRASIVLYAEFMVF